MTRSGTPGQLDLQSDVVLSSYSARLRFRFFVFAVADRPSDSQGGWPCLERVIWTMFRVAPYIVCRWTATPLAVGSSFGGSLDDIGGRRPGTTLSWHTPHLDPHSRTRAQRALTYGRSVSRPRCDSSASRPAGSLDSVRRIQLARAHADHGQLDHGPEVDGQLLGLAASRRLSLSQPTPLGSVPPGVHRSVELHPAVARPLVGPPGDDRSDPPAP